MNSTSLKVPSGLIGSAWEWYHWKGIEKDINRYRFLIFKFWSWIFEKTSKFWAASYKNATNPPTFPPNRSQKMQESKQLVFRLRLVSKDFQHPAIQTRIVQHLGGFFHQINVRQPIGRKASIQTEILTSRRLDSFLYESAQNFKVFSNIQDQNLKIKNT